MFNSQCAILSRSGVGLRVVRSVRIRIEHWELNIGQIPIGHSAKLFLRESLGYYPLALNSGGQSLADTRPGHAPVSFFKVILRFTAGRRTITCLMAALLPLIL